MSASFCIVLSCVQLEALRRADHPAKEFYQLFNRFISFRKINSETEQAKRPNPWKDDDASYCLNVSRSGMPKWNDFIKKIFWS
jgi:hypothetical protein